MFINATGVYVPAERVHNDYFLELNGLTSEWIEQRTGIISRSKAQLEENINTMGLEAIRDALPKLPYNITEVDLIIAASYSPYDTVATAAHVAQKEFNMTKAKALYLSSACSSFLNALEVVEGYFAMGKATKALIISADKNSAYSNDTDPKAGHLWGDAAAFFISKEQMSTGEPRIEEIYTEGLGHISKGPEGVQLRPRDGGIMMPEGKVSLFRLVRICLRMYSMYWRRMGIHWMIFPILSATRQICVLCLILRNNWNYRKKSSCTILRSWGIPVRSVPLWSTPSMSIFSKRETLYVLRSLAEDIQPGPV